MSLCTHLFVSVVGAWLLVNCSPWQTLCIAAVRTAWPLLVFSWEQLSSAIPLSKTFTIQRKFIASFIVNPFEMDRKHLLAWVHFFHSSPLHQKLASIQATTLHYRSKCKQQTLLASRLSKTKSHNNSVHEILRPWSSGMWGHSMQMVMLVGHENSNSW